VSAALVAALLWAGPAVAQDTPAEPEAASAADQDGENSDVQVAEDESERADVVPDEDEAASSDRIQFRADPLDFVEEPFGSKWDRFVSGLTGITRYSFWDGQLRFRLGLRFQVDGTAVSPSDRLEQDLGPMSSDVAARRFRIFAEGILKKMYFRTEFDFGTDAGFKSAYLEGREGGLEIWGHLLGKFRYGLFQEPFSLENNMSSFDTSFIEYSMPLSAIAPGANLGAMVYDASENRTFTWAVGAFSWGQKTADNASTSSLSLTGRFGYQPVRRNDDGEVLHLGLSVSTRSPTSDNVRYQARPEARSVRPFADTGTVGTNNLSMYGLELAWKRGSSWLHAEWIRSDVDTVEGTRGFGGVVLQAGRFLTGLSRPWDNLHGVWGRVRPDSRYTGGNPFKASNGGEWEVAARYSSVDLTDGHVDGGLVRDYTVGVNWYPADTWKLQFNWVHSRVENSGYANIWILRYQFFVR